MHEGKITIKRALISVSDKTGLISFAQGLAEQGVSLISTGGTAKTLEEANIPHAKISEITGFPEIMEGRVKTLHPLVHGGILGLRDEHQAIAAAHQIKWIDLVVCNLYPFVQTVAKHASFDSAIENIDIGGPAMLRAAAKNIGWAAAVVDPEDYEMVLAAIRQGQFDFNLRRMLSAKAYRHTASYDGHIAAYLNRDLDEPSLIEQELVQVNLSREEQLRYGENPQQQAALFTTPFGYGLANALMLQGKPLSYNNLVDAEAALECVHQFEENACIIVKHANPCGVALGNTITDAYNRAFAADSLAAFGGVIALNRTCNAEIATALSNIFMELIIAPDFSAEALDILAKKPNLRVLRVPHWEKINNPWRFKSISGGMLIQNADSSSLDIAALPCVTIKKPDEQTTKELCFAWQVVKYLKSNAIAITKDRCTLGLGAGQVSRIDALKLALQKSGENLMGAVVASDAFFPFRDSIDALAATPIKAIIQPGGSIRDKEVIAACNEYGIAMLFTGTRVFNH